MPVTQSSNTGRIRRRGARPRRVPRAVREQQMLELAERLFAARGFHAVSVDVIAEAAGVSKPMVYAYFGSKDGLYRACMARAEERLFSSVGRGAAVATAAEEQLWFGLLAFFTFVDEHRDSWVVLFGEPASGAGTFAPEAARIRRRVARQVSRLLHDAAAAEGVDPRRLVATEPLGNALVGAAESLADWWLEHPEHSRETVATWLMNFAWLGFGNLVRGQAWLAGGGRPRASRGKD
jgi:AcrR family transcriptional regulator